MRRAFVFLSIVSLALIFARPSLASPPTASSDRNEKVEWKTGQWPRVTPWEVAGGLAATALGLVLESTWDGNTSEYEVEVPVLDPGARYLLRGRTAKVQRTFDRLSNYGWRMMAVFPYVDVGVTYAIHRNGDVAAQMTLIDFQALTLSGLTYLLASRGAGRARPYRQDCDSRQDITTSKGCDVPFDNWSFYGGHAAAAFTSAGLTCVHHQHLPLYGGGAVESWACLWALSVATFTGAARVVADEHYASDVIVGAGVGWFYGYVMPKLLHYKDRPIQPQERKPGQIRWMPSFTVTDGGGMISVGAAL